MKKAISIAVMLAVMLSALSFSVYAESVSINGSRYSYT